MADPQEPETLDAHPLVRAAKELESRRPDAWREGNCRLYEYLRQAAPDLPDTLEAMQPLYTAVVHGCRAGRQQEAMEVYKRRILRESEHFSWQKLGAFGSELTALAGFFDRPWSQPSGLLTAPSQRPPGPRRPPALSFRLPRRSHGSYRGLGDCRARADAAS